MGRGGTPKPRCFNNKCNAILSALDCRVKTQDSGENARRKVGLVCWSCNFYFLQNPFTGTITAIEAGNPVPQAQYVKYKGQTFVKGDDE